MSTRFEVVGTCRKCKARWSESRQRDGKFVCLEGNADCPSKPVASIAYLPLLELYTWKARIEKEIARREGKRD